MRFISHAFGSSHETLESPFLDEEVTPRPGSDDENDQSERDDWIADAGEAEADFEGDDASNEREDDFSFEDEADPIGGEAEAPVTTLWAAEEELDSEIVEEAFDWEDREEPPFVAPGEQGWFETEAADTTLVNDRFYIDPDYTNDSGEKAPVVWRHSDRIRDLLRTKGDPGDKERQELASAVIRQLPTVVLFWRTVSFMGAKSGPTAGKPLTLYALVFPSEARDNTGIKDLNDKILGFELTSEYIRRRQEEIEGLFPKKIPDDGLKKIDDLFLLVGHDYKTSLILTIEGKREEFARRLAKLDRKLRDILLTEMLPQAEKQAKDDKERLAAINKLKKALKPENYRFDIFFGLASAQPKSGPTFLETVYLLVTEALKGAGLSKMIAKGSSVKSKAARQFTKGMKIDHRSLDTRGKQYDAKTFLAAAKKAGDIKALVTRKYSADHPWDYYHIYVNTVWTVAFLTYRRWFVGHPDVIRDVRKKALEKPPVRRGVKYTYEIQRELLELWLVVLNMLDYIKDFLLGEFRKELVTYHRDGLAAFTQLIQRPTVPIDWARLEHFLTHDLRPKRIAVLGTTSEFQFYSSAADHPARIFFMMDVRDLGIAVALCYENANEEIEQHKHTGVKLMDETLKSTDPINVQRRFTHDRIVEVFRKYWARVGTSNADVITVNAQQAFGKGLRVGSLSGFERTVQVMLGGDEVFVAADPAYAREVHNIIRELASVPLSEGNLNVRTAVAFSWPPNAIPSRSDVQDSHHRAMTAAGLAPTILKRLERTHRRIERLIEKLEANAKKVDAAPKFRIDLDKLGLVRVFARVVYDHPMSFSAERFRRLSKLLKAGDLLGAVKTKDVELVDFGGKVVDAEKLEKDAERLEEEVRKKVGADNVHVDPPPAPPKWVKALLDWLFKDRDDKDKDKGKTK